MKRLLLLLLFSTWLFAGPSMRPSTYEGIQEANKLIDTKQYDDAFNLFNALLADTSKNRKYDHAFIQNALGYFWIQKQAYQKAIEAYQKALDYNILPKEMKLSIILTLAQLFLQEGDYRKSLSLIQSWHAQKAPTELSSKLMMIALISLDKKDEALLWCNQAIALAIAPELSLYQTKLSLELQLAKKLEAIDSLRIILKNFQPKLIYFKQLAYLYTEQGKEQESVALLESAYQMDLLTQKDDLIQLCGLLHQEGSALKAAQIMSQLVKAYPEDEKLHTYLAALHLETKELDKALALLEVEYLKFKKTKTALKIAQLYAQNANWEKTIAYAMKIKNDPQALLLHAIALSQSHQVTQAVTLFQQALKYKQTQRDAKMWLNHLNH